MILHNYIAKLRGQLPPESDAMQCPFEGDTVTNHPQTYRIRKIEDVGPYVTRYRCGACGLTWRHDRTPHGQFGGKGVVGNPYHSFKRGLKISERG